MVRYEKNSFISIWPEELITNKYVRDAKYRDIEIVQIEYACEDKYIVEYIYKVPNEKQIFPDVIMKIIDD